MSVYLAILQAMEVGVAQKWWLFQVKELAS